MRNTIIAMTEKKYEQIRKKALAFLSSQAKVKKISLIELEERTGFAQNNISRMLMGKYSPSLDNFLKLSEAIGVSLTEIENNINGKR